MKENMLRQDEKTGENYSLKSVTFCTTGTHLIQGCW